MSVFKRGGYYYYEFTFRGQRHRQSTRMTNKTAALRVEALKKADLLRGRACIERPSFKSFVENEFLPCLGLDFRLYDLRHTFGSRAVMAGVDPPTLKELMGHSTVTMTMRYVHPTPQHKREALRKVEKFQGTPEITPVSEGVESRIPVNY